MKILATNKKAYHLYTIISKLEVGIALTGTEVKSVIKSNLNISDAFIINKKQEAFIINMYIAPYEQGNINNVDPLRTRKLLLHKYEIIKLFFEAKKNKLAIIVLNVYSKKNKIKLEIALAKSKKIYDKREAEKKKELQRAAGFYKV